MSVEQAQRSVNQIDKEIADLLNFPTSITSANA